MGQVWEARDELLARTVAIKEVRFPPDVPEEERAQMGERTMREARLTARLSHRGIVTIYDVVSVEGRPWIVMELVRAPSLADRIDAEGPLPQRAVAKIGLQLLDALAVAHREGIVHRDVKPSNVLLADDRVVLTDFGIATSESDATLTSTGLLIGSPTYMSPERLRGEGIGPAADMWSVGATLYAALEAGPPFRATTTMGTITAVLVDDPRPPRATGALRAAVLGMLEKNVESRLTCSEAADLLREAAEDLIGTAAVSPDTPVSPIHAPPVMAPVVTWERSEPTPPAPPTAAPAASLPAGWSAAGGLSILNPEGSGSATAEGSEAAVGGNGAGSGVDNSAELASWSDEDGDAPPRRRVGLLGALTAFVALALVALVIVWTQLTGAETSASLDDPAGLANTGRTGDRPQDKTAKPTETTTTRTKTTPTRTTATKPSPTRSTPTKTTPRTSSTTPTTSAPTTTTSPTTTSPPTTTAQNAGDAPPGFDLAQDPLGFEVAVPEGWYRRLDGATRVDYVNPTNSGNYLRIDQIPQAGPDAYDAWVDYEQDLPDLFPGYQLLRLERVDFRGWPAADLEWTYSGSSGTMRVLDRGFITDPRGFALLMSGPASTWESESRPVFDVAAATFNPTFTP